MIKLSVAHATQRRQFKQRIADFEIACAHLESLHSHDAVAVVCKGIPGGFNGTFNDFGSLVC